MSLSELNVLGVAVFAGKLLKGEIVLDFCPKDSEETEAALKIIGLLRYKKKLVKDKGFRGESITVFAVFQDVEEVMRFIRENGFEVNMIEEDLLSYEQAA